MKKIYSVNKWSVIVPMLFVAFGLFGVNESAWAGTAKLTLRAIANSSKGGYVMVSESSNASFSGTATDQSKDKTGDTGWHGLSSKQLTLYAYASAKAGCVFLGWAESATGTIISTDTKISYTTDKLYYSQTESKTYYAIFARMVANTPAAGSTTSFEDTNVGEESGWKQIKIDHAHAGTVSISQSGNDGDFYVASSTSATSEFSSFSSTTEGTKTIYVKFVPQNNGLRTCTLTVSSNNGLSSLTYYLQGTGYNEPSITWVDGDGNELTSGETTLSVGDVLRASCSTGQTVSYSNVNSSYFTQGTDDSGNPILTVKEGISGTIENVSVTGNLAKSTSSYYAAFSEDFSLNITNLTPQTIEWTNDLSDISDEMIGHTIPLNAVAKDAKTGANTGLAISYSMEANSYMSLSGNVLTVKAIGGPVAITATAAGNANYAPTSVTKYATVIDMSTPCAISDGHSNGQFNQGNHHDIYPTLPTSLTFKVRKESGWLLKNLVVTQYNSNGTQIKQDKKSYGEITDSGTGTDVTITCDPAVTTIRFAADGKARYTYYITNITTTRKTEISVKQGANAVTSLSYSTDPGQSLGKQITVTYSNIPVFLSFKSDEDAGVKGTSLWSLSTSKFGGCGKKGSQNVTVTFQSNAKGDFTDTLYVRNNVGDLLHTIKLSAAVTAQEQFLKYWNIEDVYNTTDQVTLQASTTVDNTDFTFTATTSNPANIVSISNAGVMTFSGSGTATIRAYQPGDPMSQEFETTRNITINKVAPDIAENPSVAPIKYKDSFANGLFSGGKATVTLRGVENTEVEGTFGWTNSGNVADGEGSHDYSVTFTPTNGNMYAPKVFTLPVTVSRAAGGIVMKDGSVKVKISNINDNLDECKIALNGLIQSKINDAGHEGAVSYVFKDTQTKNTTGASIDGNNIFSATVVGTYTLVAKQAQTDYYTEATDEFDIVVEQVVPTFNGTDNYSMKVSAEQPEAFSFVDVETLVPHITHHINEINNGDGQVIEYDEVNNKIIAHNAGTAEIYFTQAETETNAGGTSAVFHYTVTKHEPKFTWNKNNKEYYYESTIANIFETTNTVTDTTVRSNNPTAAYVENNTLHILNVEENTTFTLHQAENYYWAEKEMDVTITPKVTDNHVTFTIDNNNKDYMVTINNTDYVEWDNNGYKMGNSINAVFKNAPETYVIISFTGTPEKLTFTKTCDRLLGFLPVSGECLFEVYESANGEDWGSPIWSFNEEEESRDVTDVPPLNPTTRYLKLRYHGTICGHFNNIKVTELKRFDADKEIVDFGEQGAAFGVQEMQLNFTHANAGRTTNMEIVGPDAAYFSVEPNVLPETGRDITGTVNFHITFDNGKDRRGTNPYNAELVFTDNLGHEERVVLTGVRNGLSVPTFTFNPNNLPYYYGSTIANVAVSTNTDYTNCRLSYQTTDRDIAFVDETGLHIGNKPGEVMITVHQDGGGDFREWSQVFTFTPRERPSLHTPFVVTSSVFNNAGKSGSNCSWNNDENRVELGYSGLGGFNWDNKSFTLVFDGMPDSLSFQYACSASGTTGVAVWQVKESADGSNWTQVWIDGAHSKAWQTMHASLKESTRYLQFIYSANFAGYLKDIKVTGIEGYAFLRAGDGRYLSRGADWSTRAIVDEYGVACRITRTTDDNTNYKTRLQFADSENYLFETGNTIYTDNKTNNVSTIYWNIEENAGTVTIQSANNTAHNGHYVTVNEDGVLAFTSDAAQATHWYKDGAAQYQNYITQKLDQQATAAAQYDFEGLTTLAAVRKELNDNEYDFNVIDVPAVAEYIEQKGDYRNGAGVIQNNYEYVAEDLIPGFYKLTVQGFNRMGSQKAAYTMFANNMESSLAYIYANDVKYPMMSLLNVSGRRAVASPTGTDYYYPDGYFYADDKEAALVSFANEKAYLNDVYVYVNADEGKETGTLRYGIRNTSYINGAWLIYGNIKLYRLARAEFVFDPDNNDKKWGESDNWNREDGKTPTDQSVVVVKKDAEISGSAEVYSLTIDAGVTVTVKSGATLEIHDGTPFPRAEYGNLHVENGGKVILHEGELRVNDFTLDAELGDVSRSAASGQVLDEQNKLKVAHDAYFYLTLDPTAGRNTLGWYDFVVPFAVDVIGGISIAGDESTPMQFNVNYAVMDYSEAKRAVNGKSWNKFSGTMQPGRVYTITLDETNPAWNTVIFKKKSGAPVTGDRSFTTDFCGAGVSVDNGWNGFGNGSLHHAELDVDESTLVQIYDHTNRCYQAREAHNYSIAVGTSFFMQVGGVQTITLAAADNDNIGFLAPAREPRTVERFRLALRPEEAENAVDYLWVSANEDATGEYVIGKDVLKMGTINEAKVARMWSKRDGLNLCGNEMQLTATKAQCDLGLYAPQASTYSIEVEEAPADATLFLTYEGRAIWNLSMSPYTMDLSKGTTEGYGLRIIADRQTTTDIETISDERLEISGCRKVLIDNVLYLITPDGKMYDVVGKGVKF